MIGKTAEAVAFYPAVRLARRLFDRRHDDLRFAVPILRFYKVRESNRSQLYDQVVHAAMPNISDILHLTPHAVSIRCIDQFNSPWSFRYACTRFNAMISGDPAISPIISFIAFIASRRAFTIGLINFSGLTLGGEGPGCGTSALMKTLTMRGGGTV